MDRYSPELEADAADAIHVLESVVIGAELKEKEETDEKFRDLTEVSSGGMRPDLGDLALSRKPAPVVKIF